MKQVTITRCPSCSTIGQRTDQIAHALQEQGIDPEIRDGEKGEFKVSVDGKSTPFRGDDLPSPEAVVAAAMGPTTVGP